MPASCESNKKITHLSVLQTCQFNHQKVCIKIQIRPILKSSTNLLEYDIGLMVKFKKQRLIWKERCFFLSMNYHHIFILYQRNFPNLDIYNFEERGKKPSNWYVSKWLINSIRFLINPFDFRSKTLMITQIATSTKFAFLLHFLSIICIPTTTQNTCYLFSKYQWQSKSPPPPQQM